MRNFVEKEKYGLKIAEIVKSRDIEALKKEFPSAKKLVAYSNEVLPYPYKKDSILAILAKESDRGFFNEIFAEYFSDDFHKPLALEFLQGTDALGRKINYHYFAEGLSEADKISAKLFYTKDENERSYLIRQRIIRGASSQTKEQIQAMNFYYTLRDKYVKLGGYVSQDSLNPVKVDCDDRVQEHISGDNFTLLRDFNKIPRLEFRYLSQDFDYDDYVAGVKDLDLSKPLAKQVFDKLDFPDLFYSTCYAHVINKLETTFKKAKNSKIGSDLATLSAVIGNTLVIENDYNKEYGFDKNYYAICHYQDRKISYNAKLIENEDKDVYETTLHEIVHGLDFSNKTFSIDSNVVSSAMTFLVAEKDFGIKQDDKLSKILYRAMSYDDVLWSLETLPRLMSEDFGKDKLAESSVKLTNQINQFSNKGYKALINRFHLHRDENDALYKDFHYEYLAGRGEIDKKKPEDVNLRNVLSQKTFGKLRYHLITKYNKFNMATIKEDLIIRVDSVYDKLSVLNNAFASNEDLKKLNICRMLYNVEHKLVDKGTYLEEFYYNQAVQNRHFFDEKGSFVPQRFFNGLNEQKQKAEAQTKPKEKLREIVKTYILINEAYHSLNLKPNKSIDLYKMKVPFDNDKVLHKHIQLINRNINGIYADIGQICRDEKISLPLRQKQTGR